MQLNELIGVMSLDTDFEVFDTQEDYKMVFATTPQKKNPSVTLWKTYKQVQNRQISNSWVSSLDNTITVILK